MKEGGDKTQALVDWVLHHVMDSQEWHPVPGVHIHLPSWMSLHVLMMLISSAVLLFLFCVAYKKEQKVPTGITNLLETLVVFVRDGISIPCLGEKDGRSMTPMVCTFFFFILTCNLLSLIPIFATATGNINVTAALSVVILLVMVFGAIFKNGIGGFFGAFMPHGLPLPVLLMVGPIEFVGMFVKCAALMIRLFANMLAGHIVLFSIIGLIFAMGNMFIVPAVFMGFGVYILEILVAFLQAYIFTLLATMFIGLIHHPAH
ncbi:MAG: F-type H+-transporting ATPase subunit a [Rhodothermales bacterium]|jgi:F-type H+-transporting ATPase subunit a